MEDMESQSLGKLSRFHNLNIFIIMNLSELFGLKLTFIQI